MGAISGEHVAIAINLVMEEVLSQLFILHCVQKVCYTSCNVYFNPPPPPAMLLLSE